MAFPKRTVDELKTEARVGRWKILLVEGPTDARYLGKWLSDLGLRLVPQAVTAVDPGDVRFGPECYQNNRQKVITLARAHPEGDSVRFLIDRDLDGDHGEAITSLLRTDFPAIESYALSEGVLTRLLVHLDRVAHLAVDPEGRRAELRAALDGLVGKLAAYLAPLFRLRQLHAKHGTLEFVEDYRRFRREGSDELDVERLRLVLKLPEDPELLRSPPGSCDDLRHVAYGHDIARAIWALWPDLRSKNSVQNSDDLEGLLLALVHPAELGALDLFAELRGWAA